MSVRIVLASFLVAGVSSSECDAAHAVTGFNTTEYLGKWYQIAVSKQFYDRIEKDYPLCTTAQYSLNPAGYVNVDNKAYNSAGQLDEAQGRATQADPNVAALEVSFGGPISAPYNVIKLLTDEQGRYKTALVWSCALGGLEEALWVLSRNKTISDEDYTTMIRFAADSGIDVDRLQMIKTVQNCTNFAQAAAVCDAASPITGFNTTEYLGKWYQIAVSKVFSEEFERTYPFCITAEYSLNPAGYVNVDNKGYNSAGQLNEAQGKATQANPTVAALEVSFGGPFSSPYNVIKMLTDASGKYKTALVWSCSLGGLEQALWVLSRDKTISDADYTTMIDFAKQSGINVQFLDMHKTVQNCTNAAADKAAADSLALAVPKTRRSVCDAAQPITAFNTTEYLGEWYQIAVSKQFSETFERNYPFCVTAQYSLNPAGYVNVDNKAYNSAGQLTEAQGKATQANPTVAALEVSFGGPFSSPYNVIKMLTDASGKYKTALVWSCSLGGLEQALWVLSRNKAIPESDYTTMINFAVQSGINLDMLRTVQNCTNF